MPGGCFGRYTFIVPRLSASTELESVANNVAEKCGGKLYQPRSNPCLSKCVVLYQIMT